MARIEPLHIITTAKDIKITNYNPNFKKDVRIYSYIEVIPDDKYENIKQIKGIYKYGKKINDQFKSTFNNPDPLEFVKGDGDTLKERLVSIFRNMIINDELNSFIIKGISSPGDSEQQRFINSFIAGISLILCVYEFIKKSNSNEESTILEKNPLHPLNIFFPKLPIEPNLLNPNLYNFISYYVTTFKEKHGVTISDIGKHWLNYMNNFWKIFESCFLDNEYDENLIAIHSSTMGFAHYFEERCYNANNKIQDMLISGIDNVKKHFETSNNELKEVYNSYLSELKIISNSIEEKNSKYAEQLSEKFSEFKEVIEETSDNYQTGLEEIKTELNEFIEKNRNELMEDMMKYWEKQLNEIMKIKDETCKTIKTIETDSVKKINTGVDNIFETNIKRVRDEVDEMIDTVINRKKGLISDLENFKKEQESNIVTVISNYKIEVSTTQGNIEKHYRELKEKIKKLDNKQSSNTDEYIEAINKAKNEFNKESTEILDSLESSIQTITKKEIQKVVSESSKAIVSDIFSNSFDDLTPMIKSKIQIILNESFNPALKNIIKQLEKRKNNYLTEIDNNKKSMIDIKNNINELYEELNDMKNYVNKNGINKNLKKKINSVKSEYELRVEEQKKLIELLENQLNENKKIYKDELKKERKEYTTKINSMIKQSEHNSNLQINKYEDLISKYNRLEAMYTVLESRLSNFIYVDKSNILDNHVDTLEQKLSVDFDNELEYKSEDMFRSAELDNKSRSAVYDNKSRSDDLDNESKSDVSENKSQSDVSENKSQSDEFDNESQSVDNVDFLQITL